MSLRRSTYYLLFGLFPFLGCDKGEPLPNQNPQTSIFLDEINLTGKDRLTSVVRVFWSGTDQDGYIQGFEISFDQQQWSFTTEYDSTFRFVLGQGGDTADIDLYVRSVDNQGLVDETPAYLKIPIKNTPPKVDFLDDFQPVDTTNTVFSLIWEATDLDGDETIDSTYIKFNDGPWTALSRNANAIRVVPADPMATGPADARVFTSFTSAPSYTVNFEQEEPMLFEGLVLNGSNTVYIQVRDKAGSDSPPDTSSTFFLKPQTSNFLMIESHVGGNAVGGVYKDAFDQNARDYDFIDLFDNNADEDIRYWNFNFRLLLDLYDRALWYSGQETFSSGVLLLEIGMFPVVEYLNDGGKIMITTYITGDIQNTSALFNLTPMDSISPREGTNQARYFAGDIAWPDSADPDLSDYSQLICSSTILNAAPYYRNPQARSFYIAPATGTGNWSGPDQIGAYFENLDGNPNFFFFSVELHLFYGDQAALADMLNRVIDQEFDW